MAVPEKITISPMDAFLKKVSQQVGKRITRDDIIVSQVIPARGVDGTNTIVRLKSNPKGKYHAQGEVRITRTDIASLFSGITVRLDPTNLYNQVELLSQLEKMYGIKLDHTDIVNAKLPTNYPADIRIRMAPLNVGLYGELVVRLEPVGRDLGALFDSVSLPGEVFSMNQPNQINGEFILSHLSFSAARAYLNQIRTGNGQIEVIHEVLERYQPGVWSLKPTMSDNNLFGAVAIAAVTVEDGRKMVAVKLNNKYCRNITGRLRLFYT